jgi:hypothetical protein
MSQEEVKALEAALDEQFALSSELRASVKILSQENERLRALVQTKMVEASEAHTARTNSYFRSQQELANTIKAIRGRRQKIEAAILMLALALLAAWTIVHW